jgi:hypothetical protein
MKSLTVILMMFAVPALAVGPAPEYLKGGTITVTLKDGKSYTFSADEYAVVKRGSEASKPSMVAEEYNPTVLIVKKEEKKNRVTMHAGTGYYKMRDSYLSGAYTISQSRDALLGISYSRKLNEEFSIGGTIHTNETITFDVGVDF